MPWKEKTVVERREQFIAEYQHGEECVAELAPRFGVSRTTAHTWMRPPTPPSAYCASLNREPFASSGPGGFSRLSV